MSNAGWKACAAAVLVLVGCHRTVASSCPEGGAVRQVEGAEACVYGDALVIETGFECPADRVHTFDLGSATVCSTDALDQDELEALCAAFEADCEGRELQTADPDVPDGTAIASDERSIPEVDADRAEDADSAPATSCAQAETCAGDFYPSTQPELEELARCRVITGELGFAGSDDGPPPPDGIASMQPLSCLEEVRGRIHIQYSALVESLHGLENLRRVGTLDIEQMTSLPSLDGLEGLEEIADGLWIYGANNSLTDVSALHGATVRGGPFSVQDTRWLSICAVEALIAALRANGSTFSEMHTGDLLPCAGECSDGVCL